jgi:hypothetical protein
MTDHYKRAAIGLEAASDGRTRAGNYFQLATAICHALLHIGKQLEKLAYGD